MRIPSRFKTPWLLALLGAGGTASAQVQPQVARQWFEEVTKLCE